jgi:carotenoid cleavage dioxygenase
MMHDFALTAGHVVFLDLPVLFDLAAARTGGMPYRWSETYPARLGVLRRDSPHADLRWLDINPGYVFHTVNAHDDGHRIVLHVIRHPHAFRPYTPAGSPSLWRWTIDLESGAVTEDQLDERPTEFPRIDERRTGLPTSFGYAVTADIPDRPTTRGAVLRYDLNTGTATSHELPAGQVPGEAVFVPADDRSGGTGWLLTFVYHPDRDASDLIVLDAADLTTAPVARIHLPRRVPYGFHGTWIPDHATYPSPAANRK